MKIGVFAAPTGSRLRGGELGCHPGGFELPRQHGGVAIQVTLFLPEMAPIAQCIEYYAVWVREIQAEGPPLTFPGRRMGSRTHGTAAARPTRR
jgi:hypothetical protein